VHDPQGSGSGYRFTIHDIIFIGHFQSANNSTITPEKQKRNSCDEAKHQRPANANGIRRAPNLPASGILKPHVVRRSLDVGSCYRLRSNVIQNLQKSHSPKTKVTLRSNRLHTVVTETAADWAAWHLPGGPPPSNVEVGQST